MKTSDLRSNFAYAMAQWDFDRQTPIGLAVSGGGDSVALLHLALNWAKQNHIKLQVICIDHQLRDSSAKDADWVRNLCQTWGVACDIRRWQGGRADLGNLQARARAARRTLIADWAKAAGIKAVMSGHTIDDQGETFLLRLARGSGVSGLSAIAPRTQAHGILWLRPFLGIQRAKLRAYLRNYDITWLEDPSNNDLRFDRVKLRQAQPMLDELGLSNQKLAFAATQLQRARAALSTQLHAQVDKVARATDLGAVQLNISGYQSLPDELRLRLLGHILRWIGGADFTPRLAALLRLDDAISAQAKHTLAGVISHPWQGHYRFYRELGAQMRTHQPYSQRWHIRYPKSPSLTLRPLGDDIVQLENWRAFNLPRGELMALPAIFNGDDLVATAAQHDLLNGFEFALRDGVDSFAIMIGAH